MKFSIPRFKLIRSPAVLALAALVAFAAVLLCAGCSGGFGAKYRIPDDLDGKPLLAITLLGHKYYYIPKQNQARLTPGHIFIYDISISVDSTKLVVTPMVGDNLVWTWDGDRTVTADDERSAGFYAQGWIWDQQ